MATLDGFSFASIDASGKGGDSTEVVSVSATVPANPNGGFVAQIALTKVSGDRFVFARAYISGITTDAGFLPLRGFPTNIEWLNTQSVTFVLEAGPYTAGTALASVTTFS